jgi:hypothetical protein
MPFLTPRVQLPALCSKTQPTSRQSEKGLGAFAETLYERADQGSSTFVWIQFAHRRHFEGFGRKPSEFFSSLLGGASEIYAALAENPRSRPRPRS